MRAGFFTPAVVNNAPQKSGKVQVLSLNSSIVQLAASKGHFLRQHAPQECISFVKKPFSLPLAQNPLFRNSPWSSL